MKLQEAAFLPVNTSSRSSQDNQPLAVAVFLHHFGGSSKTWTEVIERLARLEPSLRCLAPDLRGFGEAHTFDTGGYDIEDYADQVAELIAASGIGRYLLVGHSMGGKIALALASRRPPGLSGLLLVAPSPPSPEPVSDQEREQLRKARQDAATASKIVLAATARPLPTAIYDRAVADVLGSSPSAWSAWLEEGSRKDLSARMAAIDVPVVVLAGGDDPAMTPALLTKEIIERITGSRLIVIPDSAHLMPLDASAAVSGYVREFVRSLNAPQPPSSQRALYPQRVVRDLLSTGLVTEPTRRVLNDRLAKAPAERGVFFDDGLFRILSAVCARLVPQPADGETVDIAGEIELRLASGNGNGWRYDDLPADGEAYRIALGSLDDTARRSSRLGFCELNSAEQDRLLFAVQQNGVGGGGWGLISPRRFFEELLSEASEIYFSYPVAQEQIGYVGMADRLGWQAITLNHLAPHEPRALVPNNA